MSESDPTYLMMLGTGRGLAYVLRERKMAFPPTRRIRLEVGDCLLLYMTRNVFGNPSRDRGRVVGTAEIASPITPFEQQRHIAGRTYASGCELNITGLAPFGEGIVLADLVDQLQVFQPDPRSWSARMRRSILALPSHDARLISKKLKPFLRDPEGTVGPYLKRAESARQ